MTKLFGKLLLQQDRFFYLGKLSEKFFALVEEKVTYKFLLVSVRNKLITYSYECWHTDRSISSVHNIFRFKLIFTERGNTAQGKFND